MTPRETARMVLVHDHDGTSFLRQLGECAPLFDRPGFEGELADALRREPELVRRWNNCSEDQRWSPSAGVSGRRAFWATSTGAVRHVVDHGDEAAAVADFLHRLSVWTARREELEVGR